VEQPPELTRDHFEILVVRELRKVGFDIADVHTHRRSELSEPERGYLLELEASLARGDWRRRALIACRRQIQPVGRPEVDSVTEHVREARAEVGLLFAAAEFTPDAFAAAEEAGVALLRVVDGRTAFDSSGWSTPGHYPAWLPAYVAQAVERDATGQLRYRLLEAGQAEVIIGRLRTSPPGPLSAIRRGGTAESAPSPDRERGTGGEDARGGSPP
jgi:restriction endonuclease